MNKILKSALAAFAVTSLFAFAACAQTPTSESTGMYIDDTSITGKVKTAILQDANLKVFQIGVTTYKGTVQLSGFVDTPQMVTHAGEVASKVNGVTSVKNDLLVK